MRCFIAVELAPELKNKVAGIQQRLGDLGKIKFIEPENLHFTLKFLGEIDDEQAATVVNKLSNIAANNDAFSIDICGIGAFPSFNYIRVLWLGIGQGAEKMANLQKQINQIKIGKRSDIPHLTIGRVKFVKDKQALLSRLEELKNAEIGKMSVHIIKLKKSTLTPHGPIYEDIKEFRLQTL